MATVTCILKYANNHLTKTYQVTFDPQDTINVVTETEGLAIKADNERAKTLFPALKNGSSKKLKSSSTETKPNYEFDPPPAPPVAKHLTQDTKFCFSAPDAEPAKFVCGFRGANGEFTPYPVKDGPEFP
jgi:hypothetical protein